MSPTYEATSNKRDQQNRLVRFLQGTHESVYEYDGESHRVRIKELTSSVETKNETFVWCEDRLCQKRSGSTVARNYFAEGFGEGSSDYFYTKDHLGSVREVVTSNGTTIASRLGYSPWGEVTETGAALTEFSFSGHHWDRPSGLNLTLFRAYSPLLGRWLSEDPIGLKGGPNLYGYVGNDPTNFVDPFGLSACAPTCFEVLAPIFGSQVARFLCAGKDQPERKDCPPCPEPPPPESRRDEVPPSAKHWPCEGSHTHHYTYSYDQNPKTCECFLKKTERIECH